MYKISIDYPEDSMERSDEAQFGFRYTTKVTDYQGKKLYFNYDGDLVVEEDRFGNRIKYDKENRRIIDTYGRVITLPEDKEDSIKVNDKEVVKYFFETENNDELDPYGLLKVDNKKHLKVTYNMDEENPIIYTTQNHKNLYRTQAAKEPMTKPIAYDTDYNESELYPTLEEIILPTGAKIKYEYEKVNDFFEDKEHSYEKYKIKSRQNVETDGTVSDKYTYTYDNPTSGLIKVDKGRAAHFTVIERASDGYAVINKYDNRGRLSSKETRAGDDYTISNYQYEANNEGGYNLTQETVKKYNQNSPSEYVENVTDYEYNASQLVTKKTMGDYTETYSYSSVALPTKAEIYRGDGLSSRTVYTNDGKAITKAVTSDVKSTKATQVKSVTYRYNSNGDLTYDSSTGKTYSYNYTDMSYNKDTDTAYKQITAFYIISITTRLSISGR